MVDVGGIFAFDSQRMDCADARRLEVHDGTRLEYDVRLQWDGAHRGSAQGVYRACWAESDRDLEGRG